jgi:hypothetical protein
MTIKKLRRLTGVATGTIGIALLIYSGNIVCLPIIMLSIAAVVIP